MKRKFWLSRDHDGNNYNIHLKEPNRENVYWDYYSKPNRYQNYLQSFCRNEFEKLYPNLKLEPGQFCKVEIDIKQVGDIWELNL